MAKKKTRKKRASEPLTLSPTLKERQAKGGTMEQRRKAREKR